MGCHNRGPTSMRCTRSCLPILSLSCSAAICCDDRPHSSANKPANVASSQHIKLVPKGISNSTSPIAHLRQERAKQNKPSSCERAQLQSIHRLQLYSRTSEELTTSLPLIRSGEDVGYTIHDTKNGMLGIRLLMASHTEQDTSHYHYVACSIENTSVI